MSSPVFLWFTPRRLEVVKFLLLVLWVSGTLQQDSDTAQIFIADKNGPGILYATLQEPRDDTNIMDSPFTLIPLPDSKIDTIDYDPGNEMVYWNSFPNDRISRIQLNGTNRQVIVSTRTPHSIALDLVNGKIYWTMYNQRAISRANLDGSSVQRVFAYNRFEQPTSILVDPVNGYLLWSTRIRKRIVKTTLNGANGQLVNGIYAEAMVTEECADNTTRLFYYTYGGNGNELGVTNLDGSGDRIIKVLSIPEAIGKSLTKYGSRLFWTGVEQTEYSLTPVHEYDMRLSTLTVHNRTVTLKNGSELDINPVAIRIISNTPYNEPVAIQGCPDNIVVNIDENTSNASSLSWTEPVLNSWSSCPRLDFLGPGTNGGNFPLGITNLTYQANDAAGNKDVCNFSVTVQNPCEPNPCENGGTCADGQCTCPIGYGGMTCEDELSYVRCDSTSMSVVLDKRLLPEHSVPSDVHFLSQAEDCVANDSDPSHIEMATRYDNCGTTIQEDEDNIIFRNVVTFAKPGAGDNGAIITREYHQQIQVECCLNKVSVLTGNFQPQIGKIYINDKEHGKFSLKIARFTNDEFDTEENVDVGGVVGNGLVMLGTKLYFGVVLDSTPLVGVVVKSCWASQAGPNDEPQEALIKDQCPAEETVTVDHTLPLDLEGFSFDAFRFINEISGVTEIYIYCGVVVCSSDEAEAARLDVECGEGGPGVQRRDVSSGTRHTISYGPLSIYSSDASYAASSRESLGMFGTRAYVVGIVALVSMVTIWGVVKGCSFKIKDHESKYARIVDMD